MQLLRDLMGIGRFPELAHGLYNRHVMASVFTREHLKKLVALGGKALEQEDAFIQKSVLRRPELQRPFRSHKARFGIRRATNERFFQYLIWRALLPDFEFCVDLEREDYYDFVVRGGGEPIAVGEMKLWHSPSGVAEIPGIKRDIEKVRSSGRPGFILLTTAYTGDLACQLRFLCERLLITEESVEPYTFETLFEGSADKSEFALLGFMAENSKV